MAPAGTCEEDYQTNNGNSSKKAKNGGKMDSSQKKRKKHARHEELDEHPDDEKTPRKWKNAISKYQKEEEGTSVKKQDPREEEEESTPMAKEKAIVTSKKKTKSKPKNRDSFTEEVNSEENEVKGKKKKKEKEKEKENKKKTEEEEPSLDYKEEGRPWIVSFQLVVPSKDMGKVIGKQGACVQQLREETGALIKIEDTITFDLQNADERVIWMSSKEETLESQSAAERALLNVARLLTKAENGDEEVAKLCLKVSIPDSEMVRELQTSTEGVVSVLTRGTDRYVQIEGETGMVRRALEIIAVKLRERRGHGRSRKKKQGTVRGAVKASAQIHISKGLVAKVVGKEGATIWRLKQQSGASIEIKDPEDGGKKSIIHVKGTLAQVTRAQTLLQTFLASLTKLKK